MLVNAVFWGGPLDGEMRPLQLQIPKLKLRLESWPRVQWNQEEVTEIVPDYIEYQLTDEVVDGCRVMKYVRPGGNPAG